MGNTELKIIGWKSENCAGMEVSAGKKMGDNKVHLTKVPVELHSGPTRNLT